MVNEIGTDTEELASKPGLLLDLSLSLVARRALLASGLLSMLGGNSRDKVQSLISDLDDLVSKRPEMYAHSAADQFRLARDILTATAKLEQAVMTLVLGRYRRGFGVLGCVPSASTETEPDGDVEQLAELELVGGAV